MGAFPLPSSKFDPECLEAAVANTGPRQRMAIGQAGPQLAGTGRRRFESPGKKYTVGEYPANPGKPASEPPTPIAHTPMAGGAPSVKPAGKDKRTAPAVFKAACSKYAHRLADRPRPMSLQVLKRNGGTGIGLVSRSDRQGHSTAVR